MSTSNASDSTQRRQEFHAWTEAALAAAKLCSKPKPALQSVAGDAGFRSYYRIEATNPSLLAVDSPPATEKNQAFTHIARLLRQHGIHTPLVYAVNYEQGFMLIEDLGDVMYWPLLQNSQASGSQHYLALYRDATHCLLKMQQIPTADSGLAAYDAAKLQQEMDLLPQWFVTQLLSCTITTSTATMLHDVNKLLIASALEQPQVVVHRDYHCRNLLYVEGNNPGVIDFQDAVIGAITYDLVSLYRDCYIRWPEADVKQWVYEYYLELERRGMVAVNPDMFMRWFDWMGLQRHIKVLGIFARLYLRDGKPGYLKDLPLVIHYTLTVAKQYPEFAQFVQWFETELLPRARQQDWYREIPAERNV